MKYNTIMELPILFTFLLFIAMMLMKLRNKSTKLRPPGPWKLPIIGNIHQMIGSLPHHTLRTLSNIHGPLMRLQLGELSVLVISSPEMAMEVMKTHDVIFASRPRVLAIHAIAYNSVDIAMAPYGAYWRNLKKLCTSELLSAGRVKSFQHVRDEEISEFINLISMSAGNPINLTQKIFSLSGGIISRAAFGKKPEEQELFLSLVLEVVELAGGFSVADLFPSIQMLQVITGLKSKLEHLHTKLDTILENIINEHKMSAKSKRVTSTNGGAVEDLVDVLLKHTDGANTEFRLTSDNVKAVILDMFTGGSDTAAVTVDWAMAEMLKKPSVMAKAQAEVRRVFDVKGKVDEADFDELHYMKLVIKEVLRLHPPAPLLLPRQCEKTCEIDGYEIPVRTRVIINAWAVGRDPKYWKDPDTFDPERFVDCRSDYKGNSFEFIPFGAGRRICPGISFGLANVEHTLAELLYHFDWKLTDEMKCEDIDMTESFGVTVRRKHDMVVIPIAQVVNFLI